ncbi:glycoside hydrolase family 17 protein [Hymenopellis radicata]|nr:glycoside hydrolase family 17 protein [Hymenopellis radicata]
MAYSLEKSRKSNQRSKWIVSIQLLALVPLLTYRLATGCWQYHRDCRHYSHRRRCGSSSSNGPKQTDPNDPSTFVPDSNLHKSFYGLAYTPEGSLLPNCGNSLENVIKDIQLMSQLTTRVRLYGADCNQSALVLEAIKQTKVDMKVYLGNYPTPDSNSAYERQRDTIKEALQNYGADNVAGITVGNEFVLNYVTEHGGGPNDATGNEAGALLVADIKDTRSMLSDLNLDIKVGNSDAGSYFNNLVLEAVDYGLSNVHPWFANVSIDGAAAWTASFFEETNVQPAALLSNSPKMYIAETGWPTASKDAGNANNGASAASEANLQIFIDTFVCQANTNGTGYFFFEFTDEKWKDDTFGGVEGHWGLFHQNRTLKNVQLPDCTSP